MDSASADDHRDLLHLDSVPLIDLRYLSQPELYSLSLCSPSSLSSHRRLDDDLVIPKIDRSVFNESAGSRKQTYSRLRLAPRKPHSLSPAAPTPVPSSNPAYLDTENAQIVALLKKLFGAENPASDPDPIPLPVELGDPAPQPSDAVLQSVRDGVVESPAPVFQVDIVEGCVKEVPEFSKSGSELVPISGGGSELVPISGSGSELVPISGGGSELVPNSVGGSELVSNIGGGSELVPNSGGGDSDRKRKRGRPRKNEIRVVGSGSKSRKVVGFRADVDGNKHGVEAKEMSIVNKNGVAVDVTALGNLEDPFGEELRKQTQGFQTRQQFLEYLDGVKGEWASMRKKRKVVDASYFGDALPMGWKLILCMKKQAGRVWVICSRYISPYGQQFASCKEVSLHLLSIFGHQGVAQRNPASGTDESVDIVCKVNNGNAADLSPNGDKTNGDDLFFSSPLHVPSSNHVRQDIQPMVTGSPDRVQRGEVLNCHKCSMIYTKEDDLLHHLLTSHKGTAKRCKGTINDEVILKDGKYECQFCHKVFDEKHRYNGHLGVHIKNYVKRVEGSVGARTTQKMVQPGPAGVPPDVSNIQERTGINEQSAAGTSSARISPPIEKADATNGTYTHTPEQNLRGKVELTTKADSTDRTLAVGSCYEQGGVCEITDRTLGKGDNSSDVISAKSNVCLSPRRDKMTDNINYSSGGTDARNNSTLEISKCVIQEGSENGSVPLSGNEIAVKTANGSCISSTGEQEQAKFHGRGLICPSVKGNICDNENTDNRPFTSTTENMDVDCKDKVGNDKIISGSGNNSTGPERVNSNNQISSGGYSPFPYGNDRRFDFLNVADGNSTPIMVEPVQEKCSSSGLLSSSVEKQSFVFNNNNVFRASTSIFDEPKFNNNPWNKELTTGVAVHQTTPDGGSITSSQLERNFGNCLVFQPRWDEPTSKIRNNTNPNRSTQESLNEKRIATYLYPPSGNDPTTGFQDQVYKVSDGSMDKLKSVDARKNCESISFGSNDTRQDANAATGIDQGGSSRVTFLSPSSSEQAFTFKNYGISNNNTPEYPKQDRGYGGGSNCPSGVQQVSVEDNVKRFPSKTFEELKHENVRSYWNNGLHAALDGCHAASNRNALPSTQFDGQTFALGNKATRIGGNTVEDCKQKREPENSFLCLSGGGQNNLRPMYASMVQEPNRFQDVDRMRHNNSMAGFGNHAQPNADVMTEFMWREHGGNALQNGLAGTSSPMVQSSGSFPAYGMVSNKGGTEHFNVNEKFGSVSGFQGFRSDSTGHLEYSFMGGQEGSNSGDKVLPSYGADISQGYDSSVWYQKEALPLLPKVAERHQVTSLCVWCRNEFHHMASDSGTQMSSMGSMCPSCKAKFSGQLSLF